MHVVSVCQIVSVGHGSLQFIQGHLMSRTQWGIDGVPALLKCLGVIGVKCFSRSVVITVVIASFAIGDEAIHCAPVQHRRQRI
ncbi:hypothetical protein D3C73_1010620 [compost metagenome]